MNVMNEKAIPPARKTLDGARERLSRDPRGSFFLQAKDVSPASPASLPAVVLLAAAAVLLIAAPAVGDVYQDVVTYDWDQSRTPLATIEQQIRDAKTPAARRAIEAKLLRALANPKATYACKQFVCRALRRVGSGASVGALSKLLGDARLSHMARYALQHMPGEQAATALRSAMGRLKGKLKIGMISSLGARGDRKAVAALAGLVDGDDADLALAAIRALGRIAGPAAAKALAAARVADAMKAELADAQLLCADRMLADGETPPPRASTERCSRRGGPR